MIIAVIVSSQPSYVSLKLAFDIENEKNSSKDKDVNYFKNKNIKSNIFGLFL